VPTDVVTQLDLVVLLVQKGLGGVAETVDQLGLARVSVRVCARVGEGKGRAEAAGHDLSVILMCIWLPSTSPAVVRLDRCTTRLVHALLLGCTPHSAHMDIIWRHARPPRNDKHHLHPLMQSTNAPKLATQTVVSTVSQDTPALVAFHHMAMDHKR
jgi:hypothetical protein